MLKGLREAVGHEIDHARGRPHDHTFRYVAVTFPPLEQDIVGVIGDTGGCIISSQQYRALIEGGFRHDPSTRLRCTCVRNRATSIEVVS